MKKTKTTKPLVSVIMPVYNAENYVSEAIESMLSQTYANFELIIVNDASTDKSGEIIDKYQKKYPRIIAAIHLKKNLNAGGEGAGNIAFSKAKGEFVARMDADDIAHPKRLAKQVEFLQKNPDVALVGLCAEVINKNGKQIGNKIVPTQHEEIFKNYFTFHPVIHPTVMLRRGSLINPNTLYRRDLPSNNDYLTFFEMINSGRKFANLPDRLLKYRLHGANDSLSQVKKTFANTLAIRRMMINKGYKPTTKARMQSFMQQILIVLMPEVAVYYLYLFVRKIYTPKELLRLIVGQTKEQLSHIKLVTSIKQLIPVTST